MYKRISCLFLVLILFVSLTACSFGEIGGEKPTDTTTNTLIDGYAESTDTTSNKTNVVTNADDTTNDDNTTALTTQKSFESTSSTTTNSSKEKTTTPTVATTPKKPTTTTKKPTTTTTTAAKKPTATTTTTNNVNVEDIPVSKDENTNIEINTPEIEEEVAVNTKHVQLTQANYYQYSSLSSSDKKVYDKLLKAMNSTQNVVDVQANNISYEKALKILQKVLSDNPQLFWVLVPDSSFYCTAPESARYYFSSSIPNHRQQSIVPFPL